MNGLRSTSTFSAPFMVMPPVWSTVCVPPKWFMRATQPKSVPLSERAEKYIKKFSYFTFTPSGSLLTDTGVRALNLSCMPSENVTSMLLLPDLVIS